MDRKEAVLLVERLAYFREVASVQYKHKAFLDSIDERLIKPGLRRKETIEEIRNTKASLRAIGHKPRVKYGLHVADLVADLLGFNQKNRHALKVGIGGKPSFDKGKQVYGNRNLYSVRVGYMWKYHVYDRFYLGKYDFPYFIMSVTKVRVNIKTVELYEAVALNHSTDRLIEGYIAKSKTEPAFSAYGKTAALAVKRVENMMSDAMDAIFTKENDT